MSKKMRALRPLCCALGALAVLALASCAKDGDDGADEGAAGTSGSGGGGGGGAAGGSPPTALPVDCRAKSNPDAHDNHPSCSVSATTPKGNVGSGPALPEMLQEGFVDGDRLIFTGSHPLEDYRGVFALDLATNARTVISGSYNDPRTGKKTVGAGPEIADVRDFVKGPDGYYMIAAAPTKENLVVLKIDPATGDRTEVLDLLSDAAPCVTRGGRRLTQNTALTVSAFYDDYNTLDVGPDGTLYTGVEVAEDDPETGDILETGGVAAIKDGQCELVSVDGPAEADDVGSGFGMDRAPGALRLSGNALYATSLVDGLLRIDLATGDREIVSSKLSNIGEGPSVHKGYLAAAPDGTIWTAGGELDDSIMTAVDPATGDRKGHEIGLSSGGHNGRPLFGVHATKPFVYVGDSDNIIVIEYTTGNANIIAR